MIEHCGSEMVCGAFFWEGKMLKRINEIKNVGQFEQFNSTQEFEKNNIIFGFNGAGKSTLSDILFSLSNQSPDDILKRRTLYRENESGVKEINVSLAFDRELYRFENDIWDNHPDNMFVFNSMYIDNHVFISEEVKGDVTPIALGKDGVKLSKIRKKTIEENERIFKETNELIGIISNQGIKIKDFTSSKLTARTAQKRWEAMAKFKLFTVSEKRDIENQIKKGKSYSVELAAIEQCKEKYQKISGLKPFQIDEIVNLMKASPRVTSKEISSYLSKAMANPNIMWAISGFNNQKDRNICPMCGQEIHDSDAIKLFKGLEKYVTQKKNEKIKGLCEDIRNRVFFLQNMDIRNKIKFFKEIIDILDKNKLLLKKDTNRLIRGFGWTDRESLLVDEIVAKMKEKADNPGAFFVLYDEEKECLRLLNAVIRNFTVLETILSEIYNRVQTRVDRKYAKEDIDVLYKLSYGPCRNIAEEIISNSKTYVKNIELIGRLDVDISDCYNQGRLKLVNEYLEKLNTNIQILVSQKQYFIRLKDFKPQHIKDKSKETIFSEGESRAIAFAYFLAEIDDPENNSEDKIIVIDDPISSMDLNRKSMISYNIAEMMNQNSNQIIVMTHDISFVERVKNFIKRGVQCKELELRSGKADFVILNIHDYLTDDNQVYKEFIDDAVRSNEEIDKIIGFMSLRPYASICKIDDTDYKQIESIGTYFAHTVYSKNRATHFLPENYNAEKLQLYARFVIEKTRLEIDDSQLVNGYSFTGFNHEKIVNLYRSIPMDSMKNCRKKMMLLRPLIESCFFQLSPEDKDCFNFKSIGREYARTVTANKNNEAKLKLCKMLLELYNSTKKYHHGADEASFLGISWLNPNEGEYYNRVITEVIDGINQLGIIKNVARTA